MNARLVLIGPEPRPGEIKLKLPCIVGRSKQAGLTLIHSSISRQHCELSEYEDQLVANDLGSLNGTFINETRINEPTILPSGATLRLGSVTLQAMYGDDADLAPPPAPLAPSAPASAPAAEDSDEALEMTDFLPDDAAAEPEQEELMLEFDDEPTTEPLADKPATKSPVPAAPQPAAKPTKSAAPEKAAGPALPAGQPPVAKPAAPRPAADEETVSFRPTDAADSGDEDLDAFFKSLQ